MYVKFKVFPSVGDAYEVVVYIPNDRDREEFIDGFIEENLKNVEDWQFS